MAVEAVFQRELECTEGLHFTDDEQIIVEEGVNDGVSSAVEGRSDLLRYGAAEIDTRDRAMMIGKCHSPGDATFNNA